MRLYQLVAKGLHPVQKKNFFRLRITFYNRFANFMILTSPSTERRSWGNNIIPSTFFGHTLSCCPRKIGLSYPHTRNLFHPYSGILNLLLLWYDIIIAPPLLARHKISGNDKTSTRTMTQNSQWHRQQERRRRQWLRWRLRPQPLMSWGTREVFFGDMINRILLRTCVWVWNWNWKWKCAEGTTSPFALSLHLCSWMIGWVSLVNFSKGTNERWKKRGYAKVNQRKFVGVRWPETW